MGRKLVPLASVVCLMAAGSVLAQLPGQYPGQYPTPYPGGYPGGYPGQYPGTGLPIPTPRLPGRKSKSPADKKPSKDEVLYPYTGVIQEVKSDTIVLAAEDTRVITFKCSKITKYYRDDKEIAQKDFKSGDTVLIESRKDDDGNFYAVNVKWQPKAAATSTAPSTAAGAHPAPAASSPPPATAAANAPTEPAEAPHSEVVDVPPRMTGADNEAPPKLRRGKPQRTARTEDDADGDVTPAAPASSAPASARPVPVEVASNRVPAAAPSPAPPPSVPAPSPTILTPPAARADPDETFIAKARETSEQFSEALPNFICQQMTTRYQTEGHPVNWQAIDVVTASLVYEDGKESYLNITVNGKAKKSMEESGGSWSTGEFGTTLRDVMSPYTDARFYNRRDSTASGLSSYKYDYEVDQPNSHWRTIIGGQWVQPAYRGAIWFDKKTSRVLRIEMEARKIPDEFPADHIEWAVDYAFVRISGNEYLLPVHAENLTCWRGTSRCGRNTIDFRNYRKFTGESQILQTDSTITFQGEEKKDQPPAAAPKTKKN